MNFLRIKAPMKIFEHRIRIPNPFSKKHKPDSPRQKSTEIDTVKEVKDEPKVYDRKNSSPSTGVPEIKGTIETPHVVQEKPQKSPIMPKINVNMLAEMKKKQDMQSSLKDLTMSMTNSSDHNNSQKAVFKDPDVNACLRNGLSHENVNSKPVATPHQKIVIDSANSNDGTITTCEDVSCKENKSPLQSPINRALPALPNLKTVPKATEADSIDEILKKALEKDAVGSQENLTSVEISLKEEVTPISIKHTVVTEIRNKNSSIEDCLNEKTLDQNVYKAENKVGNLNQESLGSKSTSEELTAMKPKPAPRTSFTPTKPSVKSKPPPPVAPKPSVPSRPSLKRTSMPAVHRNSSASIKEVSTKESSNDNGSGGFYDSATLKRSVQEKVSPLSKISQIVEKPVIEENSIDCNDGDGSSNKKCSSLPRDTQIPLEFKDHEGNVPSRPNSMFCEMSNCLQFPSQKATTPTKSPANELKNKSPHSTEDSTADTSQPSTQQLKLQASNMLNISTDGLDTSRLSMCSSHHSSTEEAESDAEIIFL